MKKVALIHDWITGYRGGEKCLSVFLELYPNADIYTLIHVKGRTTDEIDKRVVKTSFLNKLPNVEKYYRYLLPFYPFAIKGFNLEKYDLVISLSHAAAKNVSVPKNCTHISYCFTPMRYIWDQAHFYFGKKTFILFPILYLLRIWDKKSSKNVTHFIAISKFISARIRCYYGRNSSVVYPPVDTEWINKKKYPKKDFYLWAGALVPYKRADLVIKTCTKFNLPLKVSGGGPMLEGLKELAGPSIEFLGKTSDEELAKLYHEAKALIFPAIEDFGMIPVECQAAGTPVIALDRGGSRETIKGYKSWVKYKKIKNFTGVLVKRTKNLKEEDLISAINDFESLDLKEEDCMNFAQTFNKERFVAQIEEIVLEYTERH